MLKLKDIKIVESKKELEALPEGKLLINTINAHSYNTALKDTFFAEALMKGDNFTCAFPVAGIDNGAAGHPI